MSELYNAARAVAELTKGTAYPMEIRSALLALDLALAHEPKACTHGIVWPELCQWCGR